jgi:hypothetical protein
MSDFDNGITNGYDWYSISGGRQDYMNYFQQAREFTLEISDTKLLECELLPAHWQYNYRSFLNYMEQSAFGLRGTVKDSVTGWPLKAEVFAVLHEIDSSWVYSDLPNGNYHRLLYSGSYTIKYSATGYNPKVYYNVSVTNHQANVLNVQLVPNGVGGINSYEVNRMISVYPNPLNGKFLYFDSEIAVDRILIYDLNGKELFKFITDPSKRELELQSMIPGMYFIRFDTQKGIAIKKILVNR